MDGSLRKRNNFDLLRLLAATQVAVMHITAHLKAELPDLLSRIIEWFPGVPIFFVISGFLIAMSYDRNRSLRQYAWNRFLRIFPALWVCFGVSIVALGIFGYLQPEIFHKRLWLWSFAQIFGHTGLAQLLGRRMFTDYGVGDINGSLWTISVELQFYFILPLMFLGSSKIQSMSLKLIIMICASIATYIYVINYWSVRSIDYKILLLYTSVFPHLFAFLAGTMCYVWFNRIRRIIEGKFLIWLLIYMSIRLVYELTGYSEYYSVEKNVVLLILYRAVLTCLVLSFAYSWRGIGDRLLKGNDISYGLYLYHMIVVNIFVHIGLTGSYGFAILAFGLSILLSWISWIWVEIQALRLKCKPLLSRA
jgi:peptidoglycan/LPS O-acetylase OafA/YrhL